MYWFKTKLNIALGACLYKKNKLKGTLLIVNLWIFSSTPWTCVYIVYIKLSDLSIIHIVLDWET